VFADSAYRSAETEEKLAARGFRSRICVRGTRGHPLSKAKARMLAIELLRPLADQGFERRCHFESHSPFIKSGLSRNDDKGRVPCTFLRIVRLERCATRFNLWSIVQRT